MRKLQIESASLERQQLDRWVLILFGVLFACYFWKYAWVTEDAFINFRVIERARAGEGLTWNPGERVQVFTSALWMLLTICASLMTGEEVWTTLGLSFVLTSVSMWVLYRSCSKSLPAFLVLVTLLLSTVSVRDYLSSGLETPLIICSLALFFYFWRSGLSHWLQVCFFAAICLLVRHDLIIMVSPFLLATLIEIRPWRSRAQMWFVLTRGFLGFLPFVAWSLFSLIYYGSPFPNTAGAKVVAGYDHLLQGWRYLGFMQFFDPIAYGLILSGAVALWALRAPARLPVFLALMLFVVYVLKVGGDYMAGRFFVGPVVMCVFCLAKSLPHIQNTSTERLSERSRRYGIWGLLLLLALQVLPPVTASDFKVVRPPFVFGIADERHHYYGSTDAKTLAIKGPNHPFRDGVVNLKSKVAISCNIGMLGYYGASDLYLIDPLALSDRFLVGMPIVSPDVRVGHFERVVLNDYVESVLAGRNRFDHPVLKRYYDDIRLIVAGDLFTVERWRAIWRNLAGVHSAWLKGVDVEKDRLQVDPGAGRESQTLNCLGSGGRLIEPVDQGGRVVLHVL